MTQYVIRGGSPLYGEVAVSGAKNAAASILPGALLVSGVCRIENVPDFEDVRVILDILKALGAKVRRVDSAAVEIDSTEISGRTIPAEPGRKIRASHFVLAALMGRFGHAVAPLPGGDRLGARPIDLPLKGLEAMGAAVKEENGLICAHVPDSKKLKGADIRFAWKTVGATMHLMLAAALADGTTVLENAAKEPHVADLAGFLNTMGADVHGAGTDTIVIRGVSSLHGGCYSLIPDQIEAGTYMAAAAAAGGKIRISRVIPEHLACISSELRKMNVQIDEGDDWVLVSRTGELKPVDIETLPYPGFPTDMQPQVAAVMCLARGKSTLTESVWKERFQYVPELCRLGARITTNGRTAVIEGGTPLNGAHLTACDIRAGAAMVIAGLAAEGVTKIDGIQHIERGYQDFPAKLAGLGADIRVCSQDAPLLTSGARIHLIGIGGSSMSGIALMLHKKGFRVSGSNSIDCETLRTLRSEGVPVTIGHRAENVEGAELVVYSMAISEDNIELQAAIERGIPTLERSELLGRISGEYGRSIAVCGTHGKTTVTAMLAQILTETKADPTVHIGGSLKAIGGSIRCGSSDLFVTEACEYRRNFMNLSPNAIVLLNIDEDHLDCYRDIDDIESSFAAFLIKLPKNGWALGSGEDSRVVRQLRQLSCPTYTFGMQAGCDYRAVDPEEDEQGYVQFDFCYREEKLGRVRMAIPGLFNAKNAAAALGAAHLLGTDMEAACEIMGHFTGAHRRFERTGTLNGAELFHDYGHHPAEMQNAVAIARKRCRNGRLWAVMQPHTFSRVKTLFQDYLSCTREADVTLVTDIYGDREPDPGDIDSGMLVEGMRRKGVNAIWTPSFEDAASAIKNGVRAGDLVITMGCGNIYLLNEML